MSTAQFTDSTSSPSTPTTSVVQSMSSTDATTATTTGPSTSIVTTTTDSGRTGTQATTPTSPTTTNMSASSAAATTTIQTPTTLSSTTTSTTQTTSVADSTSTATSEPSSIPTSSLTSTSTSEQSAPTSTSSTSTTTERTISSSSTTTSTSSTTFGPPSTTSSPSTSSSTTDNAETSTSVRTTSSSSTGTVTRVFETTLSTTQFFTTTNEQGQSTTTAPSEFTSTLTSTNLAGVVSTITQVVVNPTLSSDSGGGAGNSEFFNNKGAVAGVFLIVGLAAASICIWIAFAVRRRRRKRLLEREAIAPNSHRSPLVDDDDEAERGMTQRSSGTLPMSVRPPSAYFDSGTGPHTTRAEDRPFDPYVGYSEPQASASNTFTLNRVTVEGYVPARTSSPPSGSPDSFGHNRQPSATGSAENGQHSRSYSFGSYEPLLAAAGMSDDTPPETPGPSGQPPTPPPRNPLRPSVILTESSQNEGPSSTPKAQTGRADDRLDPALASRLNRKNTTASGLQDDQDYSRPVLGVRNLPDNASISEYSADER